MLEMVDKSRPEAIRLLDTALKDNMPPFKNFYPDYQDGNTVDLTHQKFGLEIKMMHKDLYHSLVVWLLEMSFMNFLKVKKYQNLFLNLDILED